MIVPMDRTKLSFNSPRYQQVAQAIAEGIAKGDYLVGSLLPGEEELCRQFGLSRFTVRQALRILQDTGLVTRRQGVGTSVIDRHPASKFGHVIESIDQLLQYATATQLVDHRFDNVVADANLAAELRCGEGTKFLRISALRITDRRQPPIAWTQIHLAAVYAGIADQVREFTGPISSLVEQFYGQKIVAIRQNISATAIPAPKARLLKVKPRSPGLKIDRTYAGYDGVPFEYASSVHPGSRFNLSMQLNWMNSRPTLL